MGIETVIMTVAMLASVGSTIASKMAAGDQENARQKQLRLQQRTEEAKMRRQSRVKSAQMEAMAASSGIGGQAAEIGQIDLETSFEASKDQLAQQTDLASEQISAQNDATQAQLNGQLAQTIGNFTASRLDLSTKLNDPMQTLSDTNFAYTD